MPITKSLQPLSIPLRNLHLLEGNPRRGNIDALKKSLNQFGQLKPVVYRLQRVDGHVKKQRVVIAGNHTVMAARELEWDDIAAVSADSLTDEQAKAFALADNKVHDLGHFEDEALQEFLKEMSTYDQEILEATAFTQDEVQRILAQQHAPMENFLDDLIGEETASWGTDFVPIPDTIQHGLVPFQVMVTADDRNAIMQRLKTMVETDGYETSGEALTALVVGNAD